MVASFSQHRETGGTLHLPSPSGIHHVHSSTAINELRRSLSRSPSKSSDFRLFPSRPHSPATKNQSYISPSRRPTQNSIVLLPSTSNSQPHLAIPCPPSSKITRPIRRTTSTFQLSRSRALQQSPTKRALNESRDQGNAPPSSIGLEGEGKRSSPEPMTAANAGKCIAFDRPTNTPPENPFAPRPAVRVEKRRSEDSGPFSATSSPLKRSDEVMNLDEAETEIPVVKRRSLHGANSFGPDFNIFDGETTPSNTPPDVNSSSPIQSDNDSPFSGCSPTPTPNPYYRSTIPKRASSLRRSTLQQRQSERSIFARGKPVLDQEDSPIGSPMVLRNRQRISLDSQIFQPPQSPFNPPSLTSGHAHHASHPLSRTITQSSSGSSIPDDSPTHVPVHSDLAKPRPILNFSKSLPAGTARPFGQSQIQKENTESSLDPNYATPMNYKLVKPLPAAFMSTGLISKKNRNADENQNWNESKNMPDTPCKRSSNVLPVAHKQVQRVATGKPKVNRNSFGASWPSVSNQRPGTPAHGPFSKGMGIFGNSFTKSRLSRRASFGSNDGDDFSRSQSPSANHGFPLSTDSDLPPTPTKQTFNFQNSQFLSRLNESPKADSPSSDHLNTYGLNCKFSMISPTHDTDDDSDCSMEDSPSVGPRCRPAINDRSLASTLPRTPHIKNFSSYKLANTQNEHNIASPLGPKSLRQDSPHTPVEGYFPPDPSGLSISGYEGSSQHEKSIIPATPTGPRDSIINPSKRLSISRSGYGTQDIDPCLTARFEKVESIGTGEFSQVFRASNASEQPITPFQSSASKVKTEKVWAVKKSKHPFAGVKDRERRLHEVEVLKALTNSDHVIAYEDSWEDHNYLYIQTEFCEEGSLEVFLAQVGLKARLDDFRIWKILLELASGLRHIHDSGFIHLDLKPANILITFEGVLKIADFGMACAWPAKAGIEGEGDREYIGPEILMGHYDKPADIFALGLIVFEIAGNVELPDNGVSWQKLRNGDMSDVPSLTWDGDESTLRDASGNPLSNDLLSFDDLLENGGMDDFRSPCVSLDLDNGSALERSGELAEPPDFMVNAAHEGALDTVVGWMISPDPASRPVADQVLQTLGVQWVERRRRAGATIYEGNWGPADEVLAEDAEMIDV